MKSITIKDSKEKIAVGKIICVGRNYAKHAEELGNDIPDFPLIFLKPPSVLAFDGNDIIYPDYSNEMHHEVELVLLIGEEIKNAGTSKALAAIKGYAVGLDMTLRDIQSELKKKGQPWTLAKCFDTSAVVSEFVLSENYQLTGNEKIELKVNETLRQSSILNKMIFPPADIVKYISSKMTLDKGDLIFTGTPAGVGSVQKGDRLFATIENIGKLNNHIK